VNERKTEGIVRRKFEENKINFHSAKIEEQKSDFPKINKLLRNASKSGSGCGKPEFIVSFADEPTLLIVVECKSDVSKHASPKLDRYTEYAVDGALLYSSFLSKEYDVMSVAISGEDEAQAVISTFLQLNNNPPKNLGVTKLLTFEDYLELYRKDPEKEKIAIDELIKYSKKLNNQLRDDFELEEGQRPLLVSGILIALESKAFGSSYLKEKRAIDLAKSLTSTIEKILEQHQVEQKKRADMVNVYSFIETNNNIAEDLNEERNTKLRDLITEINSKVRAFMKDYKYHDVLGQFYGEFLRYANGDEGLGIVLTPREVTELFVELANVDKDSVALDNCCGTAGFLISAMKKMSTQVSGDSAKIKAIHDKQLIGIENNPKMFCLACSNMLLRGDGKSNIFYNTCFGINKSLIRNLKPTVGFLNPPYSKKKEGSEELSYVLNCMEFLEKNAISIAIVPMSCAIKNSVQKQELLKKHTLEAVMSMPDELFYPLGTITCIMVFKAHVPHNKDVDTWFGYWKRDGFIKIKNEGRVDKYNRWSEIRKTWIDDFRNKREIAGQCIKHKVSSDDEWCAEAYMKTDYSDLQDEDFENEIRKFILYKQVGL
jgi:type I restriction enzyme M protein